MLDLGKLNHGRGGKVLTLNRWLWLNRGLIDSHGDWVIISNVLRDAYVGLSIISDDSGKEPIFAGGKLEGKWYSEIVTGDGAAYIDRGV